MGQLTVVAVIIVLGVLLFAWASLKVAADKGARFPGAPEAPAAPAAAPSGALAGLGVGAVVAHEGRDYVVRGEVRFTEEGATWTAYHLDGGQTGRTWLSIDVSDGTDVALWRSVDAAGDLSPNRGTVTHEGRTYQKDGTGTAAYVTVGATGLPPSGTVSYIDYRAEGGRMLGFERWSRDGSWEVAAGAGVPTGALTVRPAAAAAGGAA